MERFYVIFLSREERKARQPKTFNRVGIVSFPHRISASLTLQHRSTLHGTRRSNASILDSSFSRATAYSRRVVDLPAGVHQDFLRLHRKWVGWFPGPGTKGGRTGVTWMISKLRRWRCSCWRASVVLLRSRHSHLMRYVSFSVPANWGTFAHHRYPNFGASSLPLSQFCVPLSSFILLDWLFFFWFISELLAFRPYIIATTFSLNLCSTSAAYCSISGHLYVLSHHRCAEILWLPVSSFLFWYLCLMSFHHLRRCPLDICFLFPHLWMSLLDDFPSQRRYPL